MLSVFEPGELCRYNGIKVFHFVFVLSDVTRKRAFWYIKTFFSFITGQAIKDHRFDCGTLVVRLKDSLGDYHILATGHGNTH